MRKTTNPFWRATKQVSGNITSTLSDYSWNFILFYFVSYIFERLVITKGQIQTPPYRFLAKQGGYAWVQTQATMMSVPNRHIRSQAIVCIHTRLRWVHRSHSVCTTASVLFLDILDTSVRQWHWGGRSNSLLRSSTIISRWPSWDRIWRILRNGL